MCALVEAGDVDLTFLFESVPSIQGSLFLFVILILGGVLICGFGVRFGIRLYRFLVALLITFSGRVCVRLLTQTLRNGETFGGAAVEKRRRLEGGGLRAVVGVVGVGVEGGHGVLIRFTKK